MAGVRGFRRLKLFRLGLRHKRRPILCPFCGRPAIGGSPHPMFGVCERCLGLHSQTSVYEFVREARLQRAAQEKLSKFVPELERNVILDPERGFVCR